jgi:hypothetical protein
MQSWCFCFGLCEAEGDLILQLSLLVGEGSHILSSSRWNIPACQLELRLASNDHSGEASHGLNPAGNTTGGLAGCEPNKSIKSDLDFMIL